MRPVGLFDDYFHRPLWLRTRCAGRTLWAFNAAHVDYLEQFVTAKLREHHPSPTTGWRNRSLAGRLPRWVQSARNRDVVRNGIARLRRKLDA